MSRQIRAVKMLRWASGTLMSGVGVILLAFGVINMIILPSDRTILRVGSDGGLLFVVAVKILLIAGAFWGGSRLRLLGKRLRQPSGEEILRDDTEFVLLLRPFEVDKYRYVDESHIVEMIEKTLWAAWFRKLLLGAPIEAPLSAALKKFYPVLTVGRPGERLPALGASRLYFDANEWQSRVEELISRARLVVVIAGASPGILWELETIVRARAVDKLVVYVSVDPNNHELSNGRWRTFRETVEATTPFVLGDMGGTLSTDVMILPGLRDEGRLAVVVRPASFDAALSAWPSTARKLGQFANSDRESELSGMVQNVLALTAPSDSCEDKEEVR